MDNIELEIHLLNSKKKNFFIAVLLTLLIGPFGLFYVSSSSAFYLIIFHIIAILVLSSAMEFWIFATIPLIITISYLICIVNAVISVNSYNNRINDNIERLLLEKKSNKKNQNTLKMLFKTNIDTPHKTSIEKLENPLKHWNCPKCNILNPNTSFVTVQSQM